jgi:putative acetyltransferase
LKQPRGLAAVEPILAVPEPPDITVAGIADLPALCEVWESSVRATHSFLKEGDIECLAPLARQELAAFTPIHCLRQVSGRVFAFVGVAQSSIEMLFVHADHRGAGAGRSLVEFAVEMLDARSVEVNEQNPQAIGFYRRMGFHVTGRSPADPHGFPILRMTLASRDHPAP